LGLPCTTLQNPQFRVQVVPKIIKVKTPLLKQSTLLGHFASWQMLFGTSLCSNLDKAVVAFFFPPVCLNHSGSRFIFGILTTNGGFCEERNQSLFIKKGLLFLK